MNNNKSQSIYCTCTKNAANCLHKCTPPPLPPPPSQDLKQQNELQLETRSLLEQRAAALAARADTVDELEEERASLRVQLESLHQEKDMDMERIEELLAQNTQLEMNAKH